MTGSDKYSHFWDLTIEELVNEALPATERVKGSNYAEAARGVLQARLALDSAKDAAEAARSSVKATYLVAIATVALFVVELIRLIDRGW